MKRRNYTAAIATASTARQSRGMQIHRIGARCYLTHTLAGEAVQLQRNSRRRA